jgi:hypothetical protein
MVGQFTRVMLLILSAGGKARITTEAPHPNGTGELPAKAAAASADLAVSLTANATTFQVLAAQYPR